MKERQYWIAVQASDLHLKTDINTQKALLRGEFNNDEYELQDLTIDELFCTYNPNAGEIRTKDGVEWKVFHFYERNMTNVNVQVSWICSDLKFYEFDKVEEGEDYEI